MNVLQITNSTSLSGGTFQMLELTKSLIKKGCDVTIACRPDSKIRVRAHELDIKCEEFPLKSDSDIASIYALYKFLKSGKFDVVHAHHPKAHAIAMIATLFARTPAFVVSRRVSFSIKEGKNIFNPLKYKFFRIDMILPVCDAIGNLLVSEGVKREKVRTVYSGTDPQRFNPDTVQSKVRQELGIKDGELVVTKIAHYSDWKGYDTLFKAARLVLAHNKNVKFVIAGSLTNSEEVLKKIANMGLTSSFCCLGERRDVPEILKASDIAVNAAYQGEGLSGAIREALFMRVPVVATDISGNGEVCISGKTGYLVPKKDELALSNALITLIEDDKSRSRMGDFGRELMLKDFTVDVMADKTLQIYNEILGRKG